jgi:hypothetical protein
VERVDGKELAVRSHYLSKTPSIKALENPDFDQALFASRVALQHLLLPRDRLSPWRVQPEQVPSEMQRGISDAWRVDYLLFNPASFHKK